MGWLFTSGTTREREVQNLLKTQQWDDKGVQVCRTALAHCYRGCRFSGILWVVWEETRNTQVTLRFIACYLLKYSKRDEGWGYKDMCESMHPYYYSCPLKYLELVPPDKFPQEINEQWRSNVRAYHQQVQAKAKATRERRKLRTVPHSEHSPVHCQCVNIQP